MEFSFFYYVWYAISANSIIGPIFYKGTLYAERYINKIRNPYFVNLHLLKKYSVTLCKTVRPHTQLKKLSELHGVCVWGEFNGEDRIISKGLWPPCIPRPYPCDFCLWGKL
jgi:hypothetical protein